MGEKARLGIIGTSWWADLMYLPALKSHPNAEVVAICGRDKDRAAALATAQGIPNVYTDYREMLAKGGLDGVIVATPDDQHRAMTVEAAGAGVHVLCEKPVALNATDAQAMRDAAEAAGILHMVMFTWRWPPVVQYLKELVDQGFIGKLYRARFAYTSGSWRNDIYEWRRDGERSNGILGDVGSHVIDLANWIVGDIANVSADVPSLMQRKALEGRRPTSDAAHLTVRFRNGAQGVIDVTALQHQGDSLLRIEIHLEGEDGSLDLEFVPFSSKPVARIISVRGDETVARELDIPARFYEGADPANFLGMFTTHSIGARLFVDSILAGRRPEPGLEWGLAAQRVVDAALKSHSERRWIDLG